jgi:hypothetical protein
MRRAVPGFAESGVGADPLHRARCATLARMVPVYVTIGLLAAWIGGAVFVGKRFGRGAAAVWLIIGAALLLARCG